MIQSFRRILIVGSTGSGKTTLAKNLAQRGALQHVELDMLMYRDNWEQTPVELFVDQVSAISASDSWLIDGNYAVVRRLTWERADLVIWLDYPLRIILGRLLRRTIVRLLRSSDLGNNNREQLNRIFGHRSIFLWAIRSHAPLRKEYEIAVASLRPDGPLIVRLRSPRQTTSWLSRVSGMQPQDAFLGEGQLSGIQWTSSKSDSAPA